MIFNFAHHDDLVQFLRPGRVICSEDFNVERAFRNLFEYFLCVKGPVEIAYSGVVSPYDQVSRSHVLPENGM